MSTAAFGPFHVAFWETLGTQCEKVKDLSEADGKTRDLALSTAEALVARYHWNVDQALLAKAPRLRMVLVAASGVDNVDMTALRNRNLRLLHEPEGNRMPAAEHALALLLTCAKRILPADASMKAGRWERAEHTSVELFGKTLGIVGLGAIGARVARFAQALGMHVHAYDPYQDEARFAILNVRHAADLGSLCAASHVLSVHCPLTAETRGMLDAAALQALPAGALLVNAARGGIVDEAALLAALETGHVASAGVDVWEEEPTPDARLAGHPRVVATPHVGAATVEARARTAHFTARTLQRWWNDPEDPDLPTPRWI